MVLLPLSKNLADYFTPNFEICPCQCDILLLSIIFNLMHSPSEAENLFNLLQNIKVLLSPLSSCFLNV